MILGKVFKYIWKLNGDKKLDFIKLTDKCNKEIQSSYNNRFTVENLKVRGILRTYIKEIEMIVAK
jgi:hypothetical protein